MPVSRDNLFIALNEGKGDIAAANLTITPSREAQVDFAQPLYSNVKELLISGPASPKVDSWSNSLVKPSLFAAPPAITTACKR